MATHQCANGRNQRLLKFSKCTRSLIGTLEKVVRANPSLSLTAEHVLNDPKGQRQQRVHAQSPNTIFEYTWSNAQEKNTRNQFRVELNYAITLFERNK